LRTTGSGEAAGRDGLSETGAGAGATSGKGLGAGMVCGRGAYRGAGDGGTGLSIGGSATIPFLAAGCVGVEGPVFLVGWGAGAWIELLITSNRPLSRAGADATAFVCC
jgi:hypothetical protein